MTQSRNAGCVSRFKMTLQTQKTKLSEIYFLFFFPEDIIPCKRGGNYSSSHFEGSHTFCRNY